MEDNGLNVSFIIRDYAYRDRFFEFYDNQRNVIKHFGLGGHQ